MSVDNSSDFVNEISDAESSPSVESSTATVVDGPRTRRQKLIATTLCVVGFMTFYLLSAGPVAGIHNVLKIRAFQKAVEVIYAPVVLLVKSNIEPFSSIMKWYVDLFR